MNIRKANAWELFTVKNTPTFRACRSGRKRPLSFGGLLRRLSPCARRFRLVAELEGNVRGYLVGVFTNAHGLLEDFLICTNEGVAEVSQALFEIFEVHCVQRSCSSIVMPAWMDEVLMRRRGFRRSGLVYVKRLPNR